MKRQGNLIHEIVDWDNLHLAYHKARKGKSSRKDVLTFQMNLRTNLLELQSQILTGGIKIGTYKSFYIHDPKKRLICAATFSERVLHHALMNVCHDRFEKYQIYDSYACRKGKGTYAAIERATGFSKKNMFFAKLDVRKYFETLDHDCLKNQLGKLFKDKHLLHVLFKIIDSFQNEEGKGLPIGNLTSQYFANHFLGVADHFAKEELNMKFYIRYMDDMVLWGQNMDELKSQVRCFMQFIEENLKCELKTPVINRLDKGLPFLGYVIHPSRLYLGQRSRKRFRNKISDLNKKRQLGEMDEMEYHRKVLPLMAFVEKADSFSFRKNYI